MLWCHLQLVFCVLTTAVVSPRKRPLEVPECEPGPSWKVDGAGQPCAAKKFKFTTPFPSSRGFESNPPPVLPLEEFAMLYERRFGRRRIIDSTRLMDGTEVQVVDSLEVTQRGITFLRSLFANNLVTITNMNLKKPSRLVASQLNSTEWNLDHDSLVFNSYTIKMIEKMFTYRVVPEISSDATAKVLSIGLGGGYINSYLHRNFRRMNITVVEIDEVMLNISRKWFGLNEDSRQRVLIRDGVQYIREAANARETFDVIFLDACTYVENAPVICPTIDSFLNEEVVENFHALLEEAEGILVINVMAMENLNAVSNLVKDVFETSFKKCNGKTFHAPIPSFVMTCADFDIEDLLPGFRKALYRQWKQYTTQS